MNSSNVKARNFNVVVEVCDLPEEVDGVYHGHTALSSKTEQAYYKGKVLSTGPRATESEHCPELAELKDDEYVIFSDLAGYHVLTEDKFCKVIRGHEIVGITTDFENMNTENVRPTAERILVEVIKENHVKDGIWDNTQDPRAQDIQYGKVISCGSTADHYEPGTIVGFEPYVGNPLVNNESVFLKTINSLDIEFIVEV